MNRQVLDFIAKVPVSHESKVLEVGSMCVNGTPRSVIKCEDYTGIDFRAGEGVDIVMNAEDVLDKFGRESFDIVLCCETLEHCENWRKVLQSSWDTLKIDGFYCLTTPTREKKRHNYPSDYWRWDMGQYEHMFYGQEMILCSSTWQRGIGAIVRKKSDVLMLDVEPEVVR